MSTSEQLPNSPDNVLAEVGKEWARMRMAHESMMLEDAQQILRTNRGEKGTSSISIGDSHNYHAAQKSASLISKVAPLAIAGLLGAGTLGGAVALLLPKPAPAPTVEVELAPPSTPPVNSDLDTQYTLDFAE